MYKKFVEAMVERTIEKYFNVTAYNREFKHSSNTDLVEFTVRTSSAKGSAKYSGFVGTVGQVVITEINNNRLSKEDVIVIN